MTRLNWEDPPPPPLGKLKQEQQAARLSAGAYSTDGRPDVSRTDYILHPNEAYSDHNITTFQHKHDPNKIFIAHRGTAIGSKGGSSDVKADLAFAVGKADDHRRFTDRLKKTEDIIRDSGATSVGLGGHSLGGGTAEYALSNSKYVRDKVNEAHLFNQAANPVFNNKSDKLTEEEINRLNDTVTKHRIGGDVVSTGLRNNNKFGKVKKYSGPKGPLAAHGIENFIDNDTGRTTHVGNKRIKKKDRHKYDAPTHTSRRLQRQASMRFV